MSQLDPQAPTTLLLHRERRKLDPRRLSTKLDVERIAGQAVRQWVLSVGWDRAGAVREIFIGGNKIGSEVEAALDSDAMLVSRCLQHGDRIADLARWLGGNDASDIAFLCARAAELEAEEGEEIRIAYAEIQSAEDGGRKSDG
jgi:hypothetical protein